VAHDVFVNGIVHDFLQQDIAAIVRIIAIADAADIHARPQPDMFQRGQGLDLAFVVIVLWIFSHRNFVAGKINKLGRMKMRKSEKRAGFPAAQIWRAAKTA
jgi:hypothetical protein